MGNCCSGAEESHETDPVLAEERRRRMAEAAERRAADNKGRGVQGGGGKIARQANDPTHVTNAVSSPNAGVQRDDPAADWSR